MIRKIYCTEHWKLCTIPLYNSLKSPVGAPVHKTTCGPLIDLANGTRLTARCHYTGPKKGLISRAQLPPTCLRNEKDEKEEEDVEDGRRRKRWRGDGGVEEEEGTRRRRTGRYGGGREKEEEEERR